MVVTTKEWFKDYTESCKNDIVNEFFQISCDMIELNGILRNYKVRRWEIVKKFRKYLPKLEYQVLKMRYGLERNTLEDCGKKLGVTRERIRQWEAKALEILDDISEDEDFKIGFKQAHQLKGKPLKECKL